MTETAMQYVWHYGAWRPLPYWRKQAEDTFGDGEIRRLEAVEERSVASHNQMFAWINNVFENLPEAYQGRWTSPDDLRKWILTYTEFCDREEFRCLSRAEAMRWLKNLMFRFDRIEIEGNTVVGYTAHSQSRKTMSKRAFQQSKDALAVVCAKILKIDVDSVYKATAA